MKKYLLLFTISLITIKGLSQGNSLYQTGLTADQNLQAIGNLAPYSVGGVGFDNRYEGVKGSPRIFDSLVPSLLKIKGQNFYIQLNTNIDVQQNLLLFIYPKTGKMMAIPYDKVNEVKIKNGEKEILYRTACSSKYNKDFREHRFFQVLKEGQYQLLKLPLKRFIAADYKEVYGADRRYDEYITYYKYYIMNPDSTLNQIQLNKKSLLRMFPDRKELINMITEGKTFDNDEDMVISVLNKF